MTGRRTTRRAHDPDSTRRAHDPDSTRRDGGTISILAVGAIVAVIASATLAVDLGRVGWSSRDQQGATDRAALDALRAITDLWNIETENWNGFGSYDAQARADDLAASSLAANTGAEGRATDARVSEVHLGTWDEPGSQFYVWNGTFGGNCGADMRNCFPTAVFVQTTASIETLFVGSAMTSGTNQVVKEAIAVVENNAHIRVGSSIATIDSNDAPYLNGIFSDLGGGGINLGVVDYNGLVDAQVGLAALFTDLGISAGTPSAVLDNTTVTVADLFTASATVLNNQGDAASLAAAAVVAQLAADVDSMLQVTLGDMLNVTSGQVGSIGDITFNAFDLVRGAISAGNGAQFATVSGFHAQLPGAASASLDLTVIEPEQHAFGPARWNPASSDWFTTASTSQLDLDLTVAMDPTPFGAYQALDITLPLHVSGGQADASATGSWCLDNQTIKGGTTETTTAAATAWIGGPNPGDWATVTTLRVSIPIIGVIDVAEVRLRATATAAPSTFTGHHEPLPETVSGGGSAIDVDSMLDPGNYQVQVVLLPNSPLNPLPLNQVALATAVVNRLVNVLPDVETTVVSRLANLMGLHIGAADTTLEEVDCEGGRILTK